MESFNRKFHATIDRLPMDIITRLGNGIFVLFISSGRHRTVSSAGWWQCHCQRIFDNVIVVDMIPLYRGCFRAV